MNKLTISVTRGKNLPELLLGRQGEHQVTQLCFDCSELEAQFGSGTAQVLCQRAGDSAPYPCAVTQEGSEVLWTVTNADTAKTGRGRLEVRWYVGDALAKSVPYATRVLRALSEESGETPEAYQDWVDEVLNAAEEIKNAGALTVVDAVSEMTDTSKQYVLSDSGFIYAYQLVESSEKLVPAFTDLLRSAKDSTGAVFQGTGYLGTDQQLWDTSPGYAATDSDFQRYVTGYIPCTPTSVIHLYGVSTQSGNYHYSKDALRFAGADYLTSSVGASKDYLFALLKDNQTKTGYTVNALDSGGEEIVIDVAQFAAETAASWPTAENIAYIQFGFVPYGEISEVYVTDGESVAWKKEEGTYQWKSTGLQYPYLVDQTYSPGSVKAQSGAAMAQALSALKTELTEKSVLVLGDSISSDAYGSYKKWVTDLIEDGFFTSENVTNDSKHATGFVRYVEAETDTVLARAKTHTADDYDLVVLFAGINDYIGGVAESDFQAAVDECFDYLAETFLSARIVVFTPLPTQYTIYNNTAGIAYSAYADYIRSKAQDYGFAVLDLAAEGNYRPWIEAWREKWTLVPDGYESADGVHPNAACFETMLEPQIKQFLRRFF